MKKKILFVFIVWLLVCNAEASGLYRMFNPISSYQNSIKEISDIKSEFFEINTNIQKEIMSLQPDEFSIELIINDEMRIISLKKNNIFSSNFKIEFSDKSKPAGKIDLGVHYWGTIDGDEKSTVGLSIYENEVVGFFSSKGLNKIIGKLKDRELYILYDDSKIPNRKGNFCDVMYEQGEFEENLQGGIETGPNGNCIEIYIEVGYDIYSDKGANTTSYITGLFNQSAVLYNNEQVPIVLQTIYIWNSADPYNGADSEAKLNQFGVIRTSFDGDIAHLVKYGSSGIGWVNTLCNSQPKYRMCYSGIYSFYNNVPTYSWSVLVFTHEMGHVFGSWHTHDCVWNGNSTAIDGCGPTAGYPPTITGCGTGSIPSSGTIMSYCHLISGVGINFSNGFGQQPGDVIRSRLNNVNCLGNCCQPDITITGSYSLNYIESDSWIKSNGATTVSSGSSLKLDANPATGGYVELNDGFLADAGSTFVAQALNGCASGLPQRNAGKNLNETNDRASVIKLYPNPTTGKVLLTGSSKLDRINVYSSMGKIVLTQTNIESASHIIDLSLFPGGIYLIEIIDESQNKQTGKISLQR